MADCVGERVGGAEEGGEVASEVGGEVADGGEVIIMIVVLGRGGVAGGVEGICGCGEGGSEGVGCVVDEGGLNGAGEGGVEDCDLDGEFDGEGRLCKLL